MKQKLIKATITIKARDYAAFEDLASELGIGIEDCTFIDNGKLVSDKGRRTGYKKHVVTEEDVKKVRKYMKANPNLSQMQIKRDLALPYGSATMSRICRGEYG